MNTHTKSSLYLPDLVQHDLKKNRKLWVTSLHLLGGLLFDGLPEFYGPTILYLVGRKKRNPELMQLAAKWQPELITWLRAEEKCELMDSELMDSSEDLHALENNEILMIAWES